jgi:uncharacterized protein (TIGR00369 family)
MVSFACKRRRALMNKAVEELRMLLNDQPKPVCAALTPFTILDVDPENGSVKLEFGPQPAFRNHVGNIQGGFAVAMLDVVVSIAAYAKLRQWPPTVEIKSSFLEPLAIGPCIGEGRVLKAGRSLVFIEGRLMTPDQRPAVTATATAVIRGNNHRRLRAPPSARFGVPSAQLRALRCDPLQRFGEVCKRHG